jgi:hypothetical protein
MVICIPAYLLAGGLMDQGLSPLAAIAAILLGNLIVLIPMALIGHAGARYGIPFAVLARASFGTSGAKIAAFARAIVACGWYGIQTWVGGNTLLVLGRRIGLGDLKAPLPVAGISAFELLAFLLFWALQLLVVTKGMRAVRRFETWTAPAKVALLLALFVWAIDRLGGIGATVSRIIMAGECGRRPVVLGAVRAGGNGDGRLLGHAVAQHPRLHPLCPLPARPDGGAGVRPAGPDGPARPGEHRDRLCDDDRLWRGDPRSARAGRPDDRMAGAGGAADHFDRHCLVQHRRQSGRPGL